MWDFKEISQITKSDNEGSKKTDLWTYGIIGWLGSEPYHDLTYHLIIIPLKTWSSFIVSSIDADIERMHWRQPTNILWQNWPKWKKNIWSEPLETSEISTPGCPSHVSTVAPPRKRFTPSSYLKNLHCSSGQCRTDNVVGRLVQCMHNAHVRITACPQTKFTSFTSEEETSSQAPSYASPKLSPTYWQGWSVELLA